MRTIPFKNPESIQLGTRFSDPIDFISIARDESPNPRRVTIWFSDGKGIKIRSRMCEVDDRKEVGVLEFTNVLAFPCDDLRINILLQPGENTQPIKLVIIESGIAAESGILLGDGNDSELVILAGAFPCSLAVRGVTSNKIKFEPEYSYEKYLRLQI